MAAQKGAITEGKNRYPPEYSFSGSIIAQKAVLRQLTIILRYFLYSIEVLSILWPGDVFDTKSWNEKTADTPMPMSPKPRIRYVFALAAPIIINFSEIFVYMYFFPFFSMPSAKLIL